MITEYLMFDENDNIVRRVLEAETQIIEVMEIEEFRNEIFEFTHKYRKTIDTDELVADDELIDENLLQLYSLYSKKHNLMVAEDIEALREKLGGISNKALAILASINVRTLERYNKGALVSAKSDKLLRQLNDQSYLLNQIRENESAIPKLDLDKMATNIGSKQGSTFIEHSIDSVAQWFLSHEAISPKRLQKLVYYTQAWSFTLLKRAFVFENGSAAQFEAWAHGPVNGTLYNKYRNYGWNRIEMKDNNDSDFDEIELDLLNSIWETYSSYSPNEIEDLTHGEAPWLNARKRANVALNARSNEIILPADMETFYRSQYIGDAI
jgi:uncharacterized phage-associated protein/DNA-binding transcriptional regulator YiaG